MTMRLCELVRAFASAVKKEWNRKGREAHFHAIQAQPQHRWKQHL